MSDDTPFGAMITTIKGFTDELHELRTSEEAARAELIRNVEEQMRAVRHDMYGSILYLEQQFVAKQKSDDEWRKDVIENRTVDRTERKAGQKLNRALLILVVVMLMLLAIGVVSLWVRSMGGP